ncbi:MAG TPA: DUF2235 domain-containing protein [Polyangiales bacterium]|nr:DUF2235 domain-containing protein [Polyangiales bacterium]
MRRLIVCCDGTWNKADQVHNGSPCPTNVVRLAYSTAKSDGATPQIIYYDQGVGTGNAIDRISGGAFGEGLEDNVHDAYRFLLANYELGDEIFLFGFSRGAFTARSIGGMVRKCGIIKRASVATYHKAVQLYRSNARPDDEGPAQFRAEHSLAGAEPIAIKFIGVWDTVGSLGIPMRGLRSLTRQRYQFHDTELSGSVQNAYHALAIDERRAPFVPTLWLDRPKPGQTVEQVWFCGAHSDVGGGYPEDGLSDIALEWMLAKAQANGLLLDPTSRPVHTLDPKPTAMLHDSKTGLYSFTFGVDRPIGLEAKKASDAADSPIDSTQSVHPSVLVRWDADPSYRPRNLRDYFNRVGDRRAGQR